MMMSSRERRVEAKQEGESNDGKLGKAAAGTISSSSRQWPGFRNPRIVRVSRSFGGKDRHSKVCTIRGLRDRRIRLSVPTAIQLYDLQDRLGLSQPSKVIDWLLDATKYDIDKLPPLQIPQGLGHHFHQQDHPSNAPFLEQGPGAYNVGEGHAKYWDNIDAVLSRGKSKQVVEKVIGAGNYNDSSSSSAHVSAQNLFPMGNNIDHSSQNISSDINMPNYYSYSLEPSNLSLSHFGSHGFLENPPAAAAAASGSQLFLCPPPSLFHPYINMVAETDPRHNIQHMLPTKPSFSSNFNPRFHMQDDDKDKDKLGR